MRGITGHDGAMPGPTTRNLDIGLLRAFAAVADRGSMTSAAEVLHLTQGAVSQQIARLEALAGAPLLSRDRPGLRLTAAGTRLLRRARRLVFLNDELWAEMRAEPVADPVRLGVPIDLVGTRFAPVLRRFAERCPAVELTLTCGATADLLRDQAAGRLDMALAEEPAGAPAGEVLATDRLVWVGAPNGTACRRSPLPVSLAAERCAFRPAIAAALRGRDWRSTFEHGSLEATVAGVRADLAVSAWLATTLQDGLEVLAPDAGLPELPAFAITLHGADHPTTPAAAELARDIRAGFRPAATG